MLDEEMTTAEVLRARFMVLLKDWMDGEPRRKQADFARECTRVAGRPCSPQAVSEWKRTGRMDKFWIPVVEQVLGGSLGFSAVNAPMSAGVAQSMSLKAEIVDQIRLIPWEEIMDQHELPQLFSVSMNDDSMAPRVRTGDKLVFDSSLSNAPRPGDGVLVKDASGQAYFRLYRAGRLGHWEAHAMNQAFATLDSERDGLRVVAVLTAVQARWG